MPTKTVPEKVRQSYQQPAEEVAIDEEAEQVSQSEEELAYRREFAERYGIGNGLMDDSSKTKDEEKWTPQSLNY